MTKISSQKITPFLWFDKEAEDAVNFYTSVFSNSQITSLMRYPKASAMLEGTVMTIDFTLEGQKFVALNGGPQFKFTHAISFVVTCSNQEEIDYFWNKLSEGGATEQCGWLRDKYGLSWQIVPENLPELLKRGNAMNELMTMTKIILADLK